MAYFSSAGSKCPSGIGRPRERKPLIGVLCCNEVAERPIQAVASRFIEPLARIAGAAVLLVPALVDSLDACAIADRFNGLLLTGSRSNVAPHLYGGGPTPTSRVDEERDTVALVLAETMIESGKPVFGICRGFQELNVLFGGSLRDLEQGTHHDGGLETAPFHQLFDHGHHVDLTHDGKLARGAETRIAVNSVHEQGICRLGGGLSVEATAPDGLIEAFSARPCGADVLAVQWHPEWDPAQSPTNQGFFTTIGSALRASVQIG